MPYTSNADLPAAVRNALPDAAQTMWRKAHDAVLRTYNGDEGKASATAWAAVKRKYRRNAEGSWVAKGIWGAVMDYFGKAPTATGDVSLEDQSSNVGDAWRTYMRTYMPSYDSWVRATFPDFVIVRDGDGYAKVPYTIDANGDITFTVEEAVEVEQTWVEKMLGEPDITATDGTPVAIAKTDDERQLVFGWANITKNTDGSIPDDSQGDVIKTANLEEYAYLYTLAFRDGDEAHTEPVAAHLVESFVSTPEKLEKMGLAPDALPEGWWTGFYIPDPAVYAKCKPGPNGEPPEYGAFSIGGYGVRTPLEGAAA